ncbi:hypothetical protein [Moorena sp. SIOASIH]|uniref:hypothetical protein n=1 Tax=Moorena sp. SIOASIH TaxID=2607817 RepID=UPI0025DA2B29|nr:hypothetical protein [Moorena sp. SIOASIH]
MREQTRVNSTRLLALVLVIAFAYTLSTFMGYSLEYTSLSLYVTTTHKNQQQLDPHHSHFKIGLLTYAWVNAMTLWSELTNTLMSLKPNKYLYFQRGLKALSQLQQQLDLYCHP